MLPANQMTGIPVWRIAPCGTTEVLLNKIHRTGNPVCASVSSHGQRSRWAAKPMMVPVADLFATRAEAAAEYRRRRAAAAPGASLNLTTDL